MIRLCKHIPTRTFTIRHPRYHDKTVLLYTNRISQHNKIVFTDALDMGTEPYYINGVKARKYPKTSNGVILCYAVPLEDLQPLEIDNRCEHEI